MPLQGNLPSNFVWCCARGQMSQHLRGRIGANGKWWKANIVGVCKEEHTVRMWKENTLMRPVTSKRKILADFDNLSWLCKWWPRSVAHASSVADTSTTTTWGNYFFSFILCICIFMLLGVILKGSKPKCIYIWMSHLQDYVEQNKCCVFCHWLEEFFFLSIFLHMLLLFWLSHVSYPHAYAQIVNKIMLR